MLPDRPTVTAKMSTDWETQSDGFVQVSNGAELKHGINQLTE
jgi:hypothetical protein